MHIAFVIVHYRQLALTHRCLQQLLQTQQSHFSIYLIDNASADGSLEDLQSAFAADSRLHWLPQNQNLGFGGGCNAGIAAALADGADGVLLLNNDAWPEADLLGPLTKTVQHYGPRALITGWIDDAEGRPWYRGGHYALWRVATWHHLQPRSAAVYPVRFASGCLLWLPRAALQQLQGFDARYFLYLEDLDLCLRARAAGLPLLCQPALRVRHQASASTGGSRSALSVYYQNRNRWLLLQAHGKAWHWPVFIVVYALGLGKRLLQPGLRQPSLRALRDALLQRWGPR
ncbi:MAG: glycosyltransferase family 2 protein [Candidatus Sericytochromatia bacterium]|nr:glycosyltransferase family 2 protein [Candidatus Sericytochromatia bacterium]